jgi:hypothetical protein
MNISSAKKECLDGNFEEAKKLIQYRCKTKPEKQARTLGQLVGALVEDGYNDIAASLLNMFNPD